MIGSPNQVFLEVRERRYSMAFECFGVNGFYFGKLDPRFQKMFYGILIIP